MEAFGAKEMSQIKLAVKAKLTEIGAYVDEELPDYILVMISNRRSKAQMKNDLSLFLGAHTEAFTEWLHVVLQRLEAFAASQVQTGSSSNEKNTETPKISEKLKVSSDKSSHTAASVALSKSSSSQKDTVQATRKQVSRNNSDSGKQSSSDKDLRSRLETKKVSSSTDELYKPTAIPAQAAVKPVVRNPPDNNEEIEDDCLNVKEDADNDDNPEDHSKRRNTISVPKESVFDKKRRLGSRTEEREVKKVCRDDRPRERRDRDDRFRREERPRRDERMRRDDRPLQRERSQREERPRPQTDIRPKIGSVVRPMGSFVQNVKTDNRRSENEKIPGDTEDQSADRNSGVPSVVRVTPRPRPPAKLQATKSLILRAVADAQKSVAAHPPKVIDIQEKQPVALFTRRYRESTTTIPTNQTNSDSKLSVTFCNNTQESPMEMEDPLVSVPPENQIASDTQSLEEEIEEEEMGSPTPCSPSFETRFIVTLDGFHLNVDDELDPEMEEQQDLVTEERNKSILRSNVKSRLYRRRSTGSDAMQQALERCKYWPKCNQGERCLYHHPSLPCKTFPNCTFGDNCLFIHPKCKYDTSCTRKMCQYTHTIKVAALPPPVKAPLTTVSKPLVAANGMSLCKYFPQCNNVSCQFYHPLACKFGSNCTRAGCSFYHPAKKTTPSSDKLKWVATK